MQARKPHSISRQAVALAAMLAASTLTAQAQTVISVSAGQQSIITDPLGSGRSALLIFQGGSSSTQFGTGDFATTGEPYQLGGAVGFLNVPKLQVGGDGGVTVSEQSVVDELGETNRTGIVTSTSINSLSATVDGPSAGSFNTLNLNGGLTFTGSRISGSLTGGKVQVSDIRVSPSTGQVIASLSGTKAALGSNPALVSSSLNTVLWTFDPVADVTGPTLIKTASLFSADPVAAMIADGYTVTATGTNAQGFTEYEYTAPTQFKNLTITAQGATFLTNALGLLVMSQDALNAVNSSAGKWGSISTALTFTTSLPEPSTYVCMGLGLVGIALAIRSRK